MYTVNPDVNGRLAAQIKNEIPENWIKNLSFENLTLYKSVTHRLTLLIFPDKSESYKHSWTMDIPKRIQLIKEPQSLRIDYWKMNLIGVVDSGLPKDRLCLGELVVELRREEMFAYNTKIWFGTGGPSVGIVDITWSLNKQGVTIWQTWKWCKQADFPTVLSR